MSFRKFLNSFFLLVLCASFSVDAADRDDMYIEAHLNFGGSSANRVEYGGVLGYLPWDEFGLGVFAEQHISHDVTSEDEAAFRSGIELRWFQEPFEVAGSLGLLSQSLRNGGSEREPAIGVETVYLLALTPSISAAARFNFLFLDNIGALFYYGIGARLLF